jgi:predicted transcriptional regulator
MKEQVAEIVAAYLRKSHVEPAALPDLIVSVSRSLGGGATHRRTRISYAGSADPAQRRSRDDHLLGLRL